MLCQRSIPVFVQSQSDGGNDNVIMRLQEKYLPPFLQNLKKAYVQGEGYLKYLHVNSKSIRVCSCEWKMCHSYCVTAFVLMKHKIYCSDCNQYFRLYVQSDKLINAELVYNMMKLGLYYAFLSLIIYGVWYLDIHMKT